MKKKLVVTICALLMAFSLVSCGGEKPEEKPAEAPAQETEAPAEKPADGETAKLKAGTYEVETKEADKNGGKAKLSITVDDAGKIIDAKYNEFDAETGKEKRDNEEYNKKMKEVAKTNPAEAEPKIEEQIKEKQSTEIDGVTGATSTSEKAKKLAEEAIKNATEGKTEKAIVDIK